MESNKGLSRILTIVATVIALIGVFMLIRIIMVGDEAIETDPEQQGIVSAFVGFSRFLLIAVTIVTLVLSLLNLFRNPQNLKKTLMGLAVLGVLLAIAYFTASGDAVIDPYTQNIIKDGEAGATSKWVSALINFTGILGAAGLGIIGYGIVKNIIK